MRNTDMSSAHDELAKRRALELLDAREMRALLAYLLRASSYDALEELLESRRWRGKL
jgi:hypothetical protein